MFVWIRPDGTIEFIYEDALRGLFALGRPTVRRASHVEPTAEGRWTADLGPSAGPLLGPFDTRAAAVAAERRWLEAAHSHTASAGDRHPCPPLG